MVTSSVTQSPPRPAGCHPCVTLKRHRSELPKLRATGSRGTTDVDQGRLRWPQRVWTSRLRSYQRPVKGAVMRQSRSTVIIYSLIGTGVALGFFGHGVLGAKGEEKFVGLITGSYDKLLGGSMSTDTATTIVNVIGV